MDVLIVTEGGKERGFGHLARCLPIYSAFVNMGIKAEFYANVDDVGTAILNKSHFVQDSWAKEDTELLNRVGNYKLILLDSLLITDSTYQELIKRSRKVAVIDDLGLRSYSNGEIIINWLVQSEREEQPEGHAHYLRGAKYAPLREAFCLHPAKNINNRISKIAITMGGTDLRMLTMPIIDRLLYVFPGIEVSAFVAEGFSNVDEFAKYEDNHAINIIYSPSDEKMVDVLKEADIAVATGGHSIYELASIGIPTIHLLVVDNQRKAEKWKETGFTYFVGWYDEPKLLDNIITAVNDLAPVMVRTKMSEAGQNTINDDGAKKVVKELMKWL